MIKIYTVPRCKYCKKVKEYLNSRNVGYEEVDMSVGGNKNTIEMKKKFKQLGLKTYPVIILDEGTENELIFPEYDEKILEDIARKENEQ